MKKILSTFILGLIVSCAFVFNVDAKTIQEETSDYNQPMFILGSTRFESTEVLSADEVLAAGFNHAKVKAMLGENITSIDYESQVFYYEPDFNEWYEIKGTTKTLLEENKAEDLENNLNIYYVNNEMKTLEIPYAGNVDEVLTEGVTYDGTAFKVPALTPVVSFTSNGSAVEVAVNANHEAVTEKAAIEVNGVYFLEQNIEEAILASSTENPVILLRDLDLPTAITITTKATIELNGHNLTVAEDTAGDGVFHVLAGGDLTINGEGTINGVGDNNWNIAIWADGGKVTINGGTYTNVGAGEDDHYDLIYAKNGGTVIINGGRFEAHTPKWTLNLKDTDGSSIAVQGGTFVNYNPAEVYTEPTQPLNFVVEGYKVVKEDNEYTVVKNA